MKVILRKDIDTLGLSGQVKDVKPGYARNFLFPRGLALEATEAAIASFERGKEKRAKTREAALAKARELVKQLSGVSLSFARPAGGEQGKIFGSVGKADILKSLKASGHEVDKDAVRLEAAIRETGDHEVEVRLMPGASAKIKVSVVARS